MGEQAHSAPRGAATRDDARAGDRLPLVLSVAFTGHRSVPDAAVARRMISEAFADIAAAFVELRASPLADAFDGGPRLRLLVGAAPGTDRAAQEAWRTGGHGELHAIYPFFDPATGGAATDNPANGDAATLVDPGPESGAWTGIDALGLGLAADQAHAEVGRWLVRHADLLLAWWDGQPGRGLGGANDTIRRALERGLPVIWLAPDAARPSLIHLGGASGPADAVNAVAEPRSVATALTPAMLAEILAPALAPPDEASPRTDRGDAAARRDYARFHLTAARSGGLGLARRLGDHTLRRTFSMFERMAGGDRPPLGPRLRPPDDFAAQPGFIRLGQAANEAAARANQLSAVRRSAQLLLIVIATLAVVVGTLPVTVPHAVPANLHTICAAIELTLGALAFAVAWAAQHAHRRRRWSDALRLAERLKSALATWPLGFDIADERVAPALAWTEWRARAVIRAAGPRRGWITPTRFRATAAWAADELIEGPIDYHESGRRIAENIERSLARLEKGAFALLMVTLLAYLVIGAASPAWFVGLVTLVSAVAPAVAAGCLALEATNGLGELKERNERLRIEFEVEKKRLGNIADAPYHEVVAVMRRAAQLRVDDTDAWRDRFLRRRIIRGP